MKVPFLVLACFVATVSLSNALTLYVAEGGGGGTGTSGANPCVLAGSPCSAFYPALISNTEATTVHISGTVPVIADLKYWSTGFTDPGNGVFAQDLTFIGSNNAVLDFGQTYSLHLDYDGGDFDLTISDVTFSRGRKSGASGNGFLVGGCLGIDAPGGAITLNRVVFDRCVLTSNGAGGGMGVRLFQATTALSLTDVDFIDNEAADDRVGGGLSAVGGVVGSISLTRVNFYGNTARVGATSLIASVVDVVDVWVEDNAANYDAVLFMEGSTGGTVQNVTVVGNSQSAAFVSEALVVVKGLDVDGLYIHDNVALGGVLDSDTVEGCIYVHDNISPSPNERDVYGLKVPGSSFNYDPSTPVGEVAIQTVQSSSAVYSSLTAVQNINTYAFSCGKDGFFVGADAEGMPLCLCADAPDANPIPVNGTALESLACECPGGGHAELSYPGGTCSPSDFVLSCVGGTSVDETEEGETPTSSTGDDGAGLSPGVLFGGILGVTVLLVGGAGVAQHYLRGPSDNPEYVKEGLKGNRSTAASGMTSMSAASAVTYQSGGTNRMTKASGISQVQPRLERGADGKVSERSSQGRRGSAGRKGSLGRKGSAGRKGNQGVGAPGGRKGSLGRKGSAGRKGSQGRKQGRV